MKTGDRASLGDIIEKVKKEYPFPEIIEDTEDAIRFLASALRESAPDGGRLLDIGCGALDKTIVFQRMGYSCFGCDDFRDPWHAHKENLEPVLAYAKETGVQVYAQDNHFTLPWDLESFDVVTMVNVIEHVHESPREILNFAGSYLKAGGLLLVAMPNSVNLRKRLSVLRGHSNYTPVQGFYENEGEWRGHVREFTLGETRQILEWNGFETIQMRTNHSMARQRLPNPIIFWMFKGISMVFPDFRDSLLVAARKPEGWVPREPDPAAKDRSLTASWVGHEG